MPLHLYQVSSVEELFAKVVAGVYQPEALHPGMKVDWQVEEQSSDPIDGKVDVMIRLMLCKLDRNRDFDISEEELRAGREMRRQKREKKAAAAMAAKINASSSVYLPGSSEKISRNHSSDGGLGNTGLPPIM